MSQFDFGDLSSPLSGAQLINDNLEPWRDALNSLHSGAARPSYATPGLMWLDNSTTPWTLKMFQGSSDIILGRLDSTTLNFTPSAVDGTTVTGLLASNVSATDPNTTGSTTVQGQLDYATKNATQAVAETGTNNTDRMTALRTKQSIDRFNDLPSSTFVTYAIPSNGGTITASSDGWLCFRAASINNSLSALTLQSGRFQVASSYQGTGSLGVIIPVTLGEVVTVRYNAIEASIITLHRCNRVI